MSDLKAGFVTYKQHINADYLARFQQPPNRELFHEYRQFIFSNKISVDYCSNDRSKKDLIELYLQK